MSLTAQEITKLENKYKKLSLTIKDGIAIFIAKNEDDFVTYAIDISKSKVKDKQKKNSKPLNYEHLSTLLDHYGVLSDSSYGQLGATETIGSDNYFIHTVASNGTAMQAGSLDADDMYTKGKPVVTNTFPLKKEYRNKGVGSRVYKTLLDKFGSFYSDESISKKAMNVYLSGAAKGYVDLYVNGERLKKGEVFEYTGSNNLLNRSIKIIDSDGEVISLAETDVKFKFNKKPDPERIKKVSPKTIQYINDSKKKAGIKPTGHVKQSTLRDAAKRAPKETKKSAGKKDWWDFMSYAEQKNYLKAYPNSKKKITKSAGSKP